MADEIVDVSQEEFDRLKSQTSSVERFPSNQARPGPKEDIIDVGQEEFNRLKEGVASLNQTFAEAGAPTMRESARDVLGFAGIAAGTEAGAGSGAALGAKVGALAGPIGAGVGLGVGAALGGGLGFFGTELARQKAVGDSINIDQAGREALVAGALTPIAPAAGAAAKLIGKGANKLAGSNAGRWLIEKGQASFRKPAEALADFLDNTDNFAKSLGVSTSDLNRLNKSFAQEAQMLPSALARAEKRGDLAKFNGKPATNFTDLADTVRMRKNVQGQKIGEVMDDIEGLFPNARVDVSDINSANMLKSMFEDVPPDTRKIAEKVIFEQAEDIKQLALTPALRTQRSRAIDTIKTISNSVERDAIEAFSDPRALDEAIRLKDWTDKRVDKTLKSLGKAFDVIEQTDEAIRVNGVAPRKIWKRRQALDAQARYDVAPGELSTKEEIKRGLANNLRAKLDDFAQGLEQNSDIGIELKEAQKRYADLATIEPFAFKAEAAQRSGGKISAEGALSFGASQAAARAAASKVSSNSFRLTLHNVGNALRGARSPQLLAQEAAEAAAKAKNPKTGAFTRNLTKALSSREAGFSADSVGVAGAIGALTNTVADAILLKAVRDEGLLEVTPEELGGLRQSEYVQQLVEMSQMQAKQLVTPAAESLRRGDMRNYELSMALLGKDVPEAFDAPKTGIAGEVRVGNTLKLPDPMDRALFIQGIVEDNEMGSKQKAKIVSRVSRDGVVISGKD